MNKRQFAVRQWLNRAYNIDYEINTLLRERNIARERMCGVSAVGYGEKVQTSGGNGQETAVVKYLEYDEKIQRRLKRLYEIKAEVIDAISAVDNSTYRQLLQLRYIEFCKWERIAEVMGYGRAQIFRIHLTALETISKMRCCNSEDCML